VILIILLSTGAFLYGRQTPPIRPESSAFQGQTPGLKSIRYPVYQFASWGGGGFTITSNETLVQTQLLPTASMIFPWGNRENWCQFANVTSSIPTSGFALTNPAYATVDVKYQMPFLVQEPLDGYGTECIGWGKAVVSKYPDLKTYNSSGRQIDYNKYDYLRVDDMNFAKQVYNDLVNIKNNYLSLGKVNGH
jgi:hypothetical protein